MTPLEKRNQWVSNEFLRHNNCEGDSSINIWGAWDDGYETGVADLQSRLDYEIKRRVAAELCLMTSYGDPREPMAEKYRNDWREIKNQQPTP